MKKTIKITVDQLNPLYFLKVDENLYRQIDKVALMQVPCRRIYSRKYLLPPKTPDGLYRFRVHYIYAASKANTRSLLDYIIPLQRSHPSVRPEDIDEDLPF